MKFKNESDWNKGLANNQDPYGSAVYSFAQQWADEMERAMADGKTVADVAEESWRTVDQRPGFGITGFMYGVAVSVLSHCWEHGEELRRWHNLDTQVGNEGERANDSGGVLNPAIVTIGK